METLVADGASAAGVQIPSAGAVRSSHVRGLGRGETRAQRDHRGGIGDKFHDAVKRLTTRFKFGKWVELQEKSCEYGGRTLKQAADYSINVSMVRYLKDRAREIRLDRGRAKNPEADATEDEITSMRGLMGKFSWATRAPCWSRPTP